MNAQPAACVVDPYFLTSGAVFTAAAEERHRRICEAAYFLAQERGFAPGHQLDDWLAAEQHIDALPQSKGGG